MFEKKKKYGWTEKGILGLVFAPMGLMFALIALLVDRSGQLTGEERLAFLLCFYIMGGAFLLTGGILLALELRRRAMQRSAYEGGYHVMATIAGLQQNQHVNMGTSHPTVVECHWTDPATGVTHVYFSRYLYIHVSDLLTGAEVPVYMDRMDPSRYYVDIDAVLPEIAVHR